MALFNGERLSLGASRETRSLPPTTPSNHQPPFPPSASNFLNQNHFPSISSVSSSHPLHPDSFSHTLNPHILNPLQQQNHAYIQQNQQFQDPQFHHLPPQFQPPVLFPSQPRHFHHPSHQNFQLPPSHYTSQPLAPSLAPDPIFDLSVPYSSASAKPLPTVAHIPILSGRTDFSAWNDGVHMLLLHLGHLSHISNPSTLGTLALPDRAASYPPTLSVPPTPTEVSTYRVWWEQDNNMSSCLAFILSFSHSSLMMTVTLIILVPHISFMIFFGRLMAYVGMLLVLLFTQTFKLCRVVHGFRSLLPSGDQVYLNSDLPIIP